ncbi:hypothetical protein V8F33_000753 [Rhypophila sp. PSN 637]
MATLQTLFFDIAYEIASSAESLADLESLILASRPCYNAFSTHRNSILSSVLLNELGPANYRELLAIAHIPAGVSAMGSHGEVRGAFHSDLETDTNDKTDEACLIAVLEPYLEHYFSTRPFEDLRDPGSISQILQVYKTIRRITDRYFAQTSELLMGVWTLSSGNMLDLNTGKAILAPISRAETARLQRAFLRYELYSRLFPYKEVESGGDDPRSRSIDIMSSISGESQFDLFIRRLEPWEVEELCSIHRFFFNLGADYMADLEDQSEESFLACPGLVWKESNGAPGTTGKWSRKRTWDAANSDTPAQLPSFGPTGVANMEISRNQSEWWSCRYVFKTKPEQIMVPFYAPEFLDPSLGFFDQYWQYIWMADFTIQLASLGLEFFSSLIDASTPKERRDKLRSLGIRHFTISGEREFLPQALTHSPEGQESSSQPDWREGGDTDENICCDNDKEDPTRPNIGYREFLHAVRQSTWTARWNSRYCGIVSRRGYGNYGFDYDFPWGFPGDPFREYGCIFWDRARLVQFRKDLEMNPGYTIGRSSDIGIGPYRSRSMGRWRKRKSVEDRLRGILIQESWWKELLGDFGWPE